MPAVVLPCPAAGLQCAEVHLDPLWVVGAVSSGFTQAVMAPLAVLCQLRRRDGGTDGSC